MRSGDLDSVPARRQLENKNLTGLHYFDARQRLRAMAPRRLEQRPETRDFSAE
jgi:hypothetical protein